MTDAERAALVERVAILGGRAGRPRSFDRFLAERTATEILAAIEPAIRAAALEEAAAEVEKSDDGSLESHAVLASVYAAAIRSLIDDRNT